MLRSIEKFPRQGSKPPWRLYQNYPRDILSLRRNPVEDGVMEFSRANAAAAGAALPPADGELKLAAQATA